MEIKPVIKNITIYPIKSLDGISLQRAKIGKGGCLEHDREYAICKSDGKYVKGKSSELVHLLRSDIDFESEIVFFRHESETEWIQFHLQKDRIAIDEYLSVFFNVRVTLQQDINGRFLDEPIVSGMTVLSSASLETVSVWFNNMSVEETRKRFRATLEIDNVPAFWEDRLFCRPGIAVEFKIGDITIYGMSPRARCVVPSRHPKTAEVIPGFQKEFATERFATMPDWSTLGEYPHTYYLAVDCYIPPSEFGKWIHVGDEVVTTGKRHTLML